MKYLLENYKLFHDLLKKLTEEHKDYFVDKMNEYAPRKIMILQSELFARTIVNKGKVLKEEKFLEIDFKIDELLPVINDYMDLLENKINFNEFINSIDLLNDKAKQSLNKVAQNETIVSNQVSQLIEDENLERFYYGLSYRPANIGSVPSGFKSEDNIVDLNFKYGIISYTRKLSKGELNSYELVDLSQNQLDRMVDEVIISMGKYSLKYMEENKKNLFVEKVKSVINRDFASKINMNKFSLFLDSIKEKVEDLYNKTTLVEVISKDEERIFDEKCNDINRMFEIGYEKADEINQISENKEANIIYLKYKGSESSKLIVDSFLNGIKKARDEWAVEDAKQVVNANVKTLNIEEQSRNPKPP